MHEIDHSPLEPNPALGAAIEKLPGRKLILTNGTRTHADAVMRRLDIHTHFEDVFDIIAAELEPKPLPQTYDRFLKQHGVDPARAAMFEDLARNLEVPHTLGMTTVLVVPEGTREVFREDWELEGRDAAHVDHVTDDLAGFLSRIGLRRGLDSTALPRPDKPRPFSPQDLPHVRSRQDHRRRLREAQRRQPDHQGRGARGGRDRARPARQRRGARRREAGRRQAGRSTSG